MQGDIYTILICVLIFQEQGDAPEIEVSASAALQNPVPALASQPFLRPTADAGLVDPANKKQEYDNPYFEPQYGFPSEDDPDAEEQVESYTPRFNQNLNGNKCVKLVHHLNECIIIIQMGSLTKPWNILYQNPACQINLSIHGGLESLVVLCCDVVWMLERFPYSYIIYCIRFCV